MAPLRVPSSDFFTDDMDFLNFSTQHPSHETRHHNRHHMHREHKPHVVDILSNSIMEAMTTRLIPDNAILPDLEPLSSHLEKEQNLKMNITMNRSDFGVLADDFMYRHSGAMTAVYCVAYLFVFVVGLVGNCFVIAVVYRSPRMRTVTNFFIVNLAVADILVIVFCLPATLMSNIFVPWVLGWLMCKTVPYVQGLSVAASVYSLVAVSLDRFLAIWWPLKCQITKRRARMIIVFIWIFAIVVTTPWVFFFDLVVVFEDNPNVRLCLDVWPNPLSEIIYFVVGNLIFCYILPMILITLCYILIWIKVWRRSIPTDTQDAQMERMQQKSKVKVVKMLVVVVILFVLSWFPLYLIFARIKLGGPIQKWEEDIFPVVTPLAQWLGSSNSCINPILYAFFNKKYRKGFFAIMKSKKCCGRLRYYETIALQSSSTSTRKSWHYNNNNHHPSFTRRSPPVDKNAVSFIFNHTGVFLAIWWPLKCQITKRRARMIIVFIWIFAIVVTTPWVFFFDLVVVFEDNPNVRLCLDVWPNPLSEIIYFVVGNLIFCYILPMILITLCYILIWIKVWRRSIPTDTQDAQMERMQQKSKVKVVKMLVVVVILFVLSWFPLYLIFARIKLGGPIQKWEEDIFPVVTPLAQWLGSSNSCINPILYAFFNKKYRKGFFAIMKSKKCCGRLRYYETIALQSSSTSTRKSWHYNNNNHHPSFTRRSPPVDKNAVSFIFNHTGV